MLLLLLFPALTVFGNVLVCLSVYRERSLQTATNFFIVSLAIADIMVAVLVMPLAVYVEVRRHCHTLQRNRATLDPSGLETSLGLRHNATKLYKFSLHASHNCDSNYKLNLFNKNYM